MKTQPILINTLKNNLKKGLHSNKKAFLGTVAALTLTATPMLGLKAQEVDTLDLRKDSVELVTNPRKEYVKEIDLERDAKAVAKSFIAEIVAAMTLIGVAIFCSYEPSQKNQNNNPRS